MKRYLINTTSSTMSALVIAGALLLTPAPAKANDGMNQLMQMLQVFVLLDQTMNGQTPQTNTGGYGTVGGNNTQAQQGNNSLSRCGYFTNVEYSGSQATITKMNRCTGEVVERTVKNRYND
jgi:hypothetical protein